MGDPTKGLTSKYRVDRVDGTDTPGGKHDGCNYFVLDLTHDANAYPAISTYADACADEYPLLAADLRQLASDQGHDPIHTVRSQLAAARADIDSLRATLATEIAEGERLREAATKAVAAARCVFAIASADYGMNVERGESVIDALDATTADPSPTEEA